MRSSRLGSPPDVKKPKQSAWVSQTREYRLITPIFGGGVEAGKPDPVTAVRGASVRGQLRFWWRATRAGRYATLKELKTAEDRLWGAASQAALIDLAVEVLDAGRDEPPFEVRPNKNGNNQAYNRSAIAPAYAAFPLQPDRDTLKQWDPEQDAVKPLRVGVVFRLTITNPQQVPQDLIAAGVTDISADIAAAIWAWESFGGVGARTRRGFGAITLTHVDGRIDGPPSASDMEIFFVKQYEQHVISTYSLVGVPRLPSFPTSLRVIRRQRQPGGIWERSIDTWSHLIAQLSEFRQWRDPPSPANPNQPGRSRWPEPDAIRIESKSHHQFHRPRLYTKKYPRAVFGLPIVVHFKDRGDPEDHTIQGADRAIDRMASQLVLKPYRSRFQDKDGYVGLAVILDGPTLPPGGIGLKPKRHPIILPVDDAALTHEDVAAIEEIASLAPRGKRSPFGKPVYSGEYLDVLQTFLNYLEQ